MKTKRMLTIALSLAILFTQEQLLLFLPNVQFSVLLVIVFVSVYNFKESMILITAYVFLDNLFLGGLNFFYMVPMFIAWYIIPLSYHTFLRKTKNELILAFFALAFGFVYGWVFIPFNMIQTGITKFIPYLLTDLPFEIIMATAGFLSVLWLFKPLYRVLTEVININEDVVLKQQN